MNIALIGSGNLATHLGKSLHAAGHDIVQVYSHTMENASVLATTVGGAPTNNIENIVSTADVYILALKDSVLPDIIPQICKGKEKKLFFHTAGSMPMHIFQGMCLHYGVLYPMQTFSKSREVSFMEIPVFIEGNDEFAQEKIHELAGSISEKIYYLTTENRKYLHLSAVWACNFANHCYDIAAEILEKNSIPFDVMLPLIDETAQKIHTLSPREAQTGPAVRYDENVIRSQAALMKDNPLLKDLYERMSLSIHRHQKK